MRQEESFNYIEQITGVKPDIEEMVRLEEKRGVQIDEAQIEARLQSLFEKELLRGNVAKVEELEDQFDRDFFIEPGRLQLLYTSILIGDLVVPEASLRFLVERTGINPSSEIIQTKYRELFANQFDPDSIGAFQKIVGVPPSAEVIQGKYRDLFESYAKTFEHDRDDEGNWDLGDRYLRQYDQLVRATGIRPQFNREYAMELYKICVSSGVECSQKIEIIAKETGVVIDQEFIQKYLLDNPKFSSPVPVSISSEQLNAHFASPFKKNLAEYIRIYKIFGCFDYYQGVLSVLEQDQSLAAKQQTIAVLAAMGLRDIGDEEHYIATKEKIMAFVKEGRVPINKSLGEALAKLAQSGDADLLVYLSSALRERIKPTGESGGDSGLIGFSPIQDVALRTLFRVNNPVANEQLLSLVFLPDLDPHVRRYILNNLIKEKPGFFPEKMKTWAESDYVGKGAEFPWDDLRYFQAVTQIPSSDLRRRSLVYLERAFWTFTERELLPSEAHRTICPAVPDNVFLSIWEFSRGEPGLLGQFNRLYENTKSSTEREALLFGIVNALSINRETLKKVVCRLEEVDLILAGGAVELGLVLKTLNFLDIVEREIGNSDEETLAILDSPIESLGKLNESLKQVAVEKIKEVLPNDAISADAIQSLWENWGNLEPIFVYAGKMASSNNHGTLRLVAEMVAHMDAPGYEGWRAWRYDRQDPRVRDQIGKLTDEQLAIWQGDNFAELGDIMIASTPSDKPKQISKFVEESLRERHIYNPEINTSDRHKAIQEKLALVYAKIAEHPERRRLILSEAIGLLQDDIDKMNIIIRFNDLPKLEQILALFAGDKKVPINAKTKNLVASLGQFLSKEKFQELSLAYKELEKRFDEETNTERREKMNANGLIDESIARYLSDKMTETRRKYEELSESDIFEKYGLGAGSSQNVGQLYQKRQELEALLNLYRISDLDVRKIATNRISERGDKKDEALTKVIDGLVQYFKDNKTFVQDLENIAFVVSRKDNLGAKRRLAIIASDNPQMLFQAGKYPFGCGSCQNYEGDPGNNQSLAGYVADAHIKVAYIVDLNNLPDHLRESVETGGVESLRENMPYQDLLEASLARAIIKITGIPTSPELSLFIEPTYSSVNKGDLSMDKYFNIFSELLLSGPMGIELARGEGEETVTVPASRNPSGQYEDCAAGNAGNVGLGIQRGSYTMSARFIDKFTPITDADRELAERIYS